MTNFPNGPANENLPSGGGGIENLTCAPDRESSNGIIAGKAESATTNFPVDQTGGSNSDDDRYLTIWGRPEEKIQKSQFGYMLNYSTWCSKECERINKAGGRARVAKRGGYVCVEKY